MNAIFTTSKSNLLGGLHYTTNHFGKMSGLHSLSTSVLANPFCEIRRKNGDSICSHCFSASMAKRYKSMNPAFIENTKILTSSILPLSVLPYTTTSYFRFESFGDIQNAIQVTNYFNLARKNPQTKFALWTKNPRFIAEAIKAGARKPKNLQIVLSSTFMNRPTHTNFEFIDKIFTVYDPEFIKANEIEINCGARSCAICGRCYNKNPKGVAIQMISEKLK